MCLVAPVLDRIGQEQERSQWGLWLENWRLVAKGFLIVCVHLRDHLIQLNTILMNIKPCAKHCGRHYRVFKSK